MLKEAKLMILANMLLAVLFVASDYLLMFNINDWSSGGAISVSWNLFQIRMGPSQYSPNTVEGIKTMGNLPLILFFLTVVVNIIFMLRLQRNKETKPRHSKLSSEA